MAWSLSSSAKDDEVLLVIKAWTVSKFVLSPVSKPRESWRMKRTLSLKRYSLSISASPVFLWDTSYSTRSLASLSIEMTKKSPNRGVVAFEIEHSVDQRRLSTPSLCAMVWRCLLYTHFFRSCEKRLTFPRSRIRNLIYGYQRSKN